MPGFHIHRSSRLERLVEELGDRLADPLGGPLDPEALVVQGRGMAIWLGSQLARRFGVWATPMLYPRELVHRLIGDDTPLSEDLLFWALQAALPELLEEKELAALRRYVEDDARGVRRAELAARIATVFDQYLTYRPDWIRAWEAGDLRGVPKSERWQPLLFRRVSERLGRPHVGDVAERFIDELGRGERPDTLPPRILVFGISTLPPLYVRVLAAVSRAVDVHLFLFSPTDRSDPLAALGQDFDAVLNRAFEESGVTRIEHEVGGEPPKVEIGLHSCHGPMREVEVLHDELLRLLTREEGRVAPEDVVVLVPDLATYAPLVEAVFAREPKQSDFIPYHVADRSEREGAPVLDGILRVMELVRGRVTASEVFDLLVLEPVQKRFGFDAASLETLRVWVSESGIRWGIDADHRERLGLPRDAANTWRFGLRRLLLGYALPTRGERTAFGVLPYDEVEGKQAVLLGSFAGFCRTLFGWLDELERARPLGEWVSVLTDLGDALFAESRDRARELARVIRVVEEASENAAAVGFAGDVDVQVLADLVARAADAAGADRGFLSGGVTFCALVPMRSIPFRVVCLLGMNDGDFPRAPRPIEFDLIKNGKLDGRPGDRSRRDDDRFLFLETLHAAREKLIVTYTGQGVRDDRARPPSVCVADLIAKRELTPTKHRLQGFSPSYFDGTRADLGSFSSEYAAAASVLRQGRQETKRFLQRALDPPELGDVRLDELVKFFKSPAAHFLNRRLGLYLRQEVTSMLDREPLELDELEKWKLGTALVEHLLSGRSLAQAEPLMRAAGLLPLGHSGQIAMGELAEPCQRVAERVRSERSAGSGEPLDVRVQLGGVAVVGSIVDRWPRKHVTYRYSKLGPKYELETWLRHLAMCATPGESAPSVLVTRDEAAPLRFRALDAAAAREHLASLVKLYAEGQERPLPFLPRTSREYLNKREKGEATALAAARRIYEENELAEGRVDPHPARAFSDEPPPFGDPEGFARAAETVYGPLLAAKEEP